MSSFRGHSAQVRAANQDLAAIKRKGIAQPLRLCQSHAMASSGPVIAYGSKWGSNTPSRWNQILLHLRAAGMVPHGEKGRLQIEGQFHGPHLVNVVLAGAAPEAGDAVSVVKRVRALTGIPSSLTSKGVQVSLLPGDMLGEALDIKVEDLADTIERETGGDPLPVDDALETLAQARKRLLAAAKQSDHPRTWMLPASLTVSLAPLTAKLEWHPCGSFHGRLDYYGTSGSTAASVAPPDGPGFRQQTVIDGSMLELAGALLSDTRYRLRRLGAVSRPCLQEPRGPKKARAPRKFPLPRRSLTSPSHSVPLLAP